MLVDKILRKIKKLKISKKIYFYFCVPARIKANFISVSNFELEYKKRWAEHNELPKGNDCFSAVSNEQNAKLSQRLEDNRKVISWLDSNKRLKNRKVLEIGCGNGTSTIALAEQGAIVTAIDVDEKLLLDAKIRCEIYGLNVKFYLMNAADVGQILSNDVFDVIIFWACLEHMTLDERINSMKATYNILPSGGLWCVIGTPNRLHFFDSHTSLMPFFHWLSDELAMKYLPFVPRLEYRDHLINNEKDKLLQFHRWGRGISFHDIEVALKPLNELNIISGLTLYYRKNNFIFNIMHRFSANGKYESFFKKLYPEIHPCFFEPYLNLIIRKN
ncbi:MAG: class I SAM-dependent methyltransferase [Bacteroidetes bacterium]|nr:class I SAM-dependent methyltransferase [Bacteroidota bacterium]